MIDPKEFLQKLEKRSVDFYVGVPDSLLKSLCSCLAESPATKHLIAANEGNAIGVAVGHYLATRKPALVYLQNSGLGNTVNPLLSLADPEVYSIPMLLVVGWRGEPGHKDEPQHVKQGKVTLECFEAMGIPAFVINRESDWSSVIASACDKMSELSGPVALVVSEGTFAPYEGPKKAVEPGLSLRREEAIHRIVSQLAPEDVVVATTGHISREVYEYRQQTQDTAGKDFLTVGGMGHSASIALGIALARPDRRVVCLDGDGSLIMHMGALAVTGNLAPKNFYHVVINNGAHDSVGGQPTAGFSCDFRQMALASRYHSARLATTMAEIDTELQALLKEEGPVFLEVRVLRGARKDLGRPKSTPKDNRDSLMTFLGVK